MNNEGAGESSKAILRAELSTRIREALEARDFLQLEHWARQWIQLEPKAPSGFKWLARASLALKQMSRAAYAYGRLLDFEPKNEEARNFFAQYPSTLTDQPASVTQSLRAKQTPVPEHQVSDHILTPDQRRTLAQKEFELGETYMVYRLFAEAGERYLKSYDWQPSRVAALGAARALHKNHKGLDAVKFLREQLYQYPDWVEGRLLMGRVLYEMGHKADAQREWQIVLEYEPSNKDALNFLRGLLTS